MLSSGAFSQEAKDYAAPSNRWLSAASVVNDSLGVSYGIASSNTREGAIETAKKACSKNNYGACKSLGAWDRGCIYVTSGNTPSGAAAYGFGPSAQAAVNACENTGADCRNTQKMINFCLRPHTGNTGKEIPQFSLAPPEPEAASKPATGIYLPAEDIGSYVVNRKYSEFTLCPDHDKANRCFVFIDGNSSANVSEDQLSEAYSKVAGALAGNRVIDTGFTKLNQLRTGTSRVRYQFADLAKGTTDGHYEGLMCLAFESEYRKPSPEWQWCGYATEVRTRRTGG